MAVQSIQANNEAASGLGIPASASQIRETTLTYWIPDDPLNAADRAKIALRVRQFSDCFKKRISAAKWLIRAFRVRFEVRRLRDIQALNLRSALITLTNMARPGRDLANGHPQSDSFEALGESWGVVLSQWALDRQKRDSEPHTKLLQPRPHREVEAILGRLETEAAQTSRRPHLRLVYSRD